MNFQEDDFYRELLSMFKIEAEEHIKNMSGGLLSLEKATDPHEQVDLVEMIYREAHSLKGAARAVNLSDVEALCQSLESIFAKLKKQQLELVPELFDTMHNAVDMLSDMIEAPGEVKSSDILQALSRIEKGELVKTDKATTNKSTSDTKQPKPPERTKKPAKTEENGEKSEKTTDNKTRTDDQDTEKTDKEADQKHVTASSKASSGTVKDMLSDTVRISTKKLDSLLLEAEDLLAVKLTVEQYGHDIRNVMNTFETWKKEWEKLSPDLRLLRQLTENNNNNKSAAPANKEAEQSSQIGVKAPVTNTLDFLDTQNNQMKYMEGQLNAISKLVENNAHVLSGKVDGLLEDMKKVLMLPFSTLFKILPKVVRDLARDQDKKVELIVRGSTIEVDRRILEEMKDPLIHILRNCVDHGLEKPDERIKHKKSAVGTITISVSQLGGSKVEILVSDDGRGIDPERVREVAVKKGIISQRKADDLTEHESLALIFQSDVSTSRIITDISGRGLGLAIVREKVEKLGGTVKLETKKGESTHFRLVLPVTLATFRGILVQESNMTFVIPTANVERVLRVKEDAIKRVEDKETVNIEGQVFSFVRMSDVLGIQKKTPSLRNTGYFQLVVLAAAETRIAFGIDHVISEQEVLVKGLGKQLSRVKNIGGASILGSGKVVAILDVSDLMKSAIKVSASFSRSDKMEASAVEQRSILIAEDSITSRTLLKNILESAGYHVKATVDGVDALTALRSEEFDLVVSDIEMPRMNGFDLVQQIRGDKKTADLPVVLVTALESREDRERGIDVGANAYIVKRSFDQSNLLEVIEKLI